jgi:aldose 1-epimerase
VVVELGGGLRSYRVGTADVVDGYRRDEACPGSRGQLLFPWPNRIANGRYSFAGRGLQLEVNEPATGGAIHGLSRSMPWRIVDVGVDRCALALDLAAQEGYPFVLGLEVAYALDDGGLTVRMAARNQGEQPCPYGAGAHPYVRIADGGLIDEAFLRIPAGAVLESDERGIPTGAERPVEGTDYDFRSPRRIGSTALDTAFTQVRADPDGITRISLTTAMGDAGVAVWMDSTLSFAMVYTGDTLADSARRRHGIAIEPMTCAPDAFNSGAGLVILQPGEAHVCTWGISPL